MSVNTVRADSMVRSQVTIADRKACLSHVSFALRAYAVASQNSIAKKTGRPQEIVECPVCKGFHIQTKRGA